MTDSMDRIFEQGARSLSAAITEGIDAITRFVETDGFRAALSELWGLPLDRRPQFVLDVLMNSDELARRGIVVPGGLTIQRSAFQNNIPTLFCITKHISRALTAEASPGLSEEKVTLTFDNPSGEPALQYSALANRQES